MKWKYSDDAIEYDISVPANCKAALILPDKEKRELSSGDHKHIFYR